jgi:transcriptional regulator with XRE-family HTH domain
MIVTEVLLANLENIWLRRGWAKEELCKQVGVGRSTLHAWESGKSKPGMDMLEQISKKLNVLLSDLLNENYDPGADTAKSTDAKEKIKNYKERFRAMQASTYKGFRYLCHAIELALADDTYLTRLTKGLYPAVARRCDASGPAVERSLRTMIEVFWVRGDLTFFQEITGHPFYRTSLIPVRSSRSWAAISKLYRRQLLHLGGVAPAFLL